MKQNKNKRFFYRSFSFFLCMLLFLKPFSTLCYGEPTENATSQEEVSDEETSENQEKTASESALQDPIETNEIPNWPTGPQIEAKGAILIEAESGTILYGKNIHEKRYPASTTKILTTLIAIENSNLDDMVTFSRNAVFSIERSSSNMGMDVGQSITMEQCLYGILVHSANEVANAVAEHVSGNIDSFVDLMNQRATELGCLNSHFVTTNGLHDENHYTTPYDLAQIGRAFFKNETLSKISGTSYYEIQPTDTQPDLIPCYTHNQITRGKYPYEGYIGGKTGYTTEARQTLVTCAERNGLKLICVVMKDESPNQFTDTLTLFDYGFNNFQKVKVSDYETRFTSKSTDFFQNKNDVFGIEGSLISVDSEDYIILPNTISFDDLNSELTINESDQDEHHIASIVYSYQDIVLGSADVNLGGSEKDNYDFESPAIEVTENTFHEDTDDKIIFVNILKILAIAVAVVIALIILIVILSFGKNYAFSRGERGPSRTIKVGGSSRNRRGHRPLFARKPKDNRIRIEDNSRRRKKKTRTDLHF